MQHQHKQITKEMSSDSTIFLKSINTLKSLNPDYYFSKFLSENSRPSNRTLDSYRPLSIHHSPLSHNNSDESSPCHGSTLINCGKTRVIAGTTLYIGTPSDVINYPDYGQVEVQLKMNPLSHGQLDTNGKIINGRSQTHLDTSVIESWIVRQVNQLNIIDLKQLCIASEKAAWKIRVTLVVLNHDGNIRDTALLALVIALADVKLPDLVSKDNKYCIIPDEEKSRKLKLRHIPISTTIGMMELKEEKTVNSENDESGKSKRKPVLFIDPDEFEESVMDGALHIIMNEHNEVLALDKVGGNVLEKELLEACMALAERHTSDAINAIKSSCLLLT